MRKPKIMLDRSAFPTLESAANKEKELVSLGLFSGATSVKYIDHGMMEEYILKKGRRVLSVFARGNKFDGGWLQVGLT